MCELMGMSFAKPVVASVSIRAFSERSKDNADGWGLAWYPDKSLALLKQPMRWSVQHTQLLENYPGLLSSIYVAHVRQRTVGSGPTHADTHPFSRELGGREYCFAHNGTLSGDFWNRPLGHFRPIGKTDSEFLFCLLLDELEHFEILAAEIENARRLSKNGNGKASRIATADANHDMFDDLPTRATGPCKGHIETEQQWKWLHQILLHLNDYGRLNCILTDGERLIVYHDKNRWKGLTYRNVFLHEDSGQHFGDATVAVDLQATPVNHGCIVATNPLSMEGWEQFLPGEMKVLYQGAIVFSNRPALQDPTAPSKTRDGALRPAPESPARELVAGNLTTMAPSRAEIGNQNQRRHLKNASEAAPSTAMSPSEKG